MNQDRVQRRLAAILAADVVGYSRLMRADETGTLARFKVVRGEILDPITAEYGGRIVKTTGDGALIEFPSAVDAVQCAVVIQQGMAVQNAPLPDDKRMDFRIGINLGDVIIEGDDIHGDGVNIAARLEGLAEPGGSYISGAVYEQVKDKLDLAFDDLGAQEVKNIAEPIRVWRVRRDGTSDPVPPAPDPDDAAPRPYNPSIAVLPFANMSGDAEQEYFADGITEDIITALSHLIGLDVLARNSSFAYKGRAVDVKQIGRELGVRYVLEGSVRRSGNRVRITSQLIDSGSGHHLWADRYDRDLDDIFAVQDEITANVVSALQIELVEGEQARRWREGTENIQAWLHFIQGRGFFYKATRDGHVRARKLLEQAVAFDPDYASAWAQLAWMDAIHAGFGWVEHPKEALKRAEDGIKKALSLDDQLPMAHTVKGLIHLTRHEFEDAVAEGEAAVAMEASGDAIMMLARYLKDAGRVDDALRVMTRGLRVMPFSVPPVLWFMGDIYRLLGRHDEAIAAFTQLREVRPDSWQAPLFLAAIYGALGRARDARAEVEALLGIDPNYSLRQLANFATYKDPAVRQALLDTLRDAGLPE